MGGMEAAIHIPVDLIKSLELNVYPKRPVKGIIGIVAQIRAGRDWVCLTGSAEQVAGLLRELADKVDDTAREPESRNDRRG
jgi:hypothetical protein